MRQGKLSELIHNSARYPDLDECSVEVHFREIIDEASNIIPLFISSHMFFVAWARRVFCGSRLDISCGSYGLQEQL